MKSFIVFRALVSPGRLLYPGHLSFLEILFEKVPCVTQKSLQPGTIDHL